MSDLFTTLAVQALGPANGEMAIRPRVRSRFEPPAPVLGLAEGGRAEAAATDELQGEQQVQEITDSTPSRHPPLRPFLPLASPGTEPFGLATGSLTPLTRETPLPSLRPLRSGLELGPQRRLLLDQSAPSVLRDSLDSSSAPLHAEAVARNTDGGVTRPSSSGASGPSPTYDRLPHEEVLLGRAHTPPPLADFHQPLPTRTFSVEESPARPSRRAPAESRTQDPLAPPSEEPEQEVLPEQAPRRCRVPANASMSEPAPTAFKQEPVIEVTIGRVEVRAITARPAATAPANAAAPKHVTLEQYLHRGTRGGAR